MQIRDLRNIQQVAYPPGGADMHVPGHMGGHAGVHHVPLSANGPHMILNQEMDEGFYHEQDAHNMDERLMNFRPNQMNGYG